MHQHEPVLMTYLFTFSLLSGTADGTLHIHDLANFSGDVKYTAKAVANVSRSNKYKHKHSVETVQWYPLDSGMFLSSGGDKLMKVWDTNSMVVGIPEKIKIVISPTKFRI